MAVKKHHGVLRFGHNAHAFCRFSFLWHMGLGVLHCHLGRTAAVGYAGVLGAKALNSDPIGSGEQKPPQLAMILLDLACWRC